MKPARWLFIAMIPALGACSFFEQGEADSGNDKPAPVKGPELLGRVASISPDRRFVLIQSYGAWEREAGAVLTSRGENERVANLLVTGESMGRFAAADIQSGTVQTGDAVYSPHVPRPPEITGGPGPSAEKPETGTNGSIENVQKNN